LLLHNGFLKAMHVCVPCAIGIELLEGIVAMLAGVAKDLSGC